MEAVSLILSHSVQKSGFKKINQKPFSIQKTSGVQDGSKNPLTCRKTRLRNLN